MKRVFLFFSVMLVGCHYNIGGGSDVGTGGVNGWIYEVMAEEYLWAKWMPTLAESGIATPTQQYFDMTLRFRSNRGTSYQNDTYGDRFSKLTRSGATRAAEPTDDFGFTPVMATGSSGEIVFLQVLYVVPGSPAEGVLKRGDAFQRVNGTVVTMDNFTELMSAATIEIELLERTAEGTPARRNVQIARGSYYERPILFDTIYTEGMPATAYMVYNQFASGDTSGPAAYNSLLRKAFARYKAAGVRNLILDLRYNGGGELSNAQLLASLLAPAAALGQTFMYTEDKTGALTEMKLLHPIAENADIEKLYVITSNHTASASELIIHTMKPVFGANMQVVGQTTVGKNVGGVDYLNPSLGWNMRLMTLRVYNRDRVSGYEAGIAPTGGGQLDEYSLTSTSSPFWALEKLGDYRNERLLNHVASTYFGVPATRGVTDSRSAGEALQPVAAIPQRGLHVGTVIVD